MGKLPVGIQSFEKIREEGYLYVDKTRYVYELVHGGVPYFLSRPRRFGKSLMISTLKAYWEGKKDLFTGLEIEKLETTWRAYPVFHFDFNGVNYQEKGALEEALNNHLSLWEKEYGSAGKPLSERFQNLLIRAKEKTGLRSVILVDEYDKPLLDLVEKPDLQQHNKEVFKGFFSTLKRLDEEIQFIFITGVSKFHKVSIFSDLNQLQDISMFEEYSGICGMTGEEICANFQPELQAMAAKRKMSEEKCLQKLARKYDGYHFFPGCQGVYNPFSVLNALSKKGFSDFWFSTGTPTFLVRRLKNMHFDVRQFAENTIYADAVNLSDYRADNPDIVPLLYQTGYLTIVGADSEEGPYILGFPNEEVRLGFLKSLFPEYAPTAVTGSGKDIFALRSHILAGDTEELKETFAALFASIPYTAKDAPFEHYFQTVVYLVFTLLGQYVHAEVHSSRGRADCVLETDRFVYIFEFKVDKSAKEALEQIEEKGYAAPYGADKRQLFKIGVNFDSESRSLSEWLVG